MQEQRFLNNPLLKLATKLAVDAVAYCDELIALRKYVIGDQLLRSATSILANSMEAQNAESGADFVHKLKISAREADEVQMWLYLIAHSKGYPDASHMSQPLKEVQMVLNSIIATTKKKIALQKSANSAKSSGEPPLAH